MGAYILRRVAAGILILVLASFVMYILVSLSGNPLAQLEAHQSVSRATIAAARAQLHLNEPLLQRYWTWLTGALHGNLGNSYTGYAVGPELMKRALVTLTLVIPTVILSVIIAIVLGVVSAVKQYSVTDHVSTGFAYLFFSTPVFVLALMLKDFLAVDVNNAVGHTWLYTIGQTSPGFTGSTFALVVNAVQHTVLPVVALTLVTYPSWSRYGRAALLDVLNADYLRLARAKGLAPRRVLFVHALRNAMIPVVTVMTIDFATILGGTIVTETVFSWEGMGRYLIEGLQGPVSPDVNVVQAWLMIAATAIIFFNLIADLLYGLLDPRIRYA